MFNLDFLVDESSFGMSQANQKCMKLTQYPNFRKKFGSLVCKGTFINHVDLTDEVGFAK